MQIECLQKVVAQSLDNDLAALVTDRKVNPMDAVQLQMLRIMRGNPNNVKHSDPDTKVTGWSADGATWLPGEPGTFTTGGVFPPEDL